MRKDFGNVTPVIPRRIRKTRNVKKETVTIISQICKEESKLLELSLLSPSCAFSSKSDLIRFLVRRWLSQQKYYNMYSRDGQTKKEKANKKEIRS